MGGRLKIRCDDLIPSRASVELNGTDITDCVQKLTLRMVAGEPNRARLTIFVDRIEVDEAVAARILAKVPPRVVVEAAS